MSPVKEKGGGHTEPFEQELDFKHAVGHYEKRFKSKFCDVLNFWIKLKMLV